MSSFNWNEYGYEEEFVEWMWDGSYDSLDLQSRYEDHLDYLAGLKHEESLVDCE